MLCRKIESTWKYLNNRCFIAIKTKKPLHSLQNVGYMEWLVKLKV